MDTRRFDQLAATFGQSHTRRTALRLFGAALAAGGLGYLGASGSDARRRKRKPRNPRKPRGGNQQPQPQPQPGPQTGPVADIAITGIAVEHTSDAAHDNVVIQFVNNGDLLAAGFRIGMVVKRSDGVLRNEVFSTPIALVPGASSTVEFRVSCAWLNNGTVTARTDPTPIPGELVTKIADNTLSQTLGAAVCS